MGPNESKLSNKHYSRSENTQTQIKRKSDAVHTSAVILSNDSLSPQSASFKQLSTAKIDKVQAKVWNPNNPDSWEADMRGYHSVEDNDYALPSDEIEQNRLEMQHYLLRAVFQGDIVCPGAKELVELDGTKVLDVGCAKGFWLESVQKDFPFGKYHGVDITENLTFKTGNINIKFGNVLERIPYEDSTFDYVHQRLLVMGMPKEKFPDTLKELIRVAKPGGWIELVETDVVLYNAGPYSKILSKAMLDAMQARGLDCYAGTNLEWYTQTMAANISNQEIKTAHIPINDGTTVGTLTGKTTPAMFLGLEDWMHKSMGITREEYREFVANCVSECSEHKSFWQVKALYFQVKK